MRRVEDNQVVEWDCLHESNNAGKVGADDNASGGEKDQSMEDLTEEAKDHTQSVEMDGSEEGSYGEEESGEEKGEKAENNSCISMYFQSKKHDLKVR